MDGQTRPQTPAVLVSSAAPAVTRVRYVMRHSILAPYVLLATLLLARGAPPDPPSPPVFQVALETNVDDPLAGPVVLEVTRSWAPFGADRFHALVAAGYYDGAAFFRVVPEFVAQWGIAADPTVSAYWNTTIPDDPVLESNLAGYVSFAIAGPDTRTTQLFVNYVNNSRLDADGFAPFARVVSGMATTARRVVNPTPGDSDGVDQDAYMAGGDAWLLANYPNISLITRATFV